MVKEGRIPLFFGTTTIHGLPDIYETESRILKLVWILCVAAAATLGIHQVDNYMKSDVVPKVSLQVTPDAKFPIFKLCATGSSELYHLHYKRMEEDGYNFSHPYLTQKSTNVMALLLSLFQNKPPSYNTTALKESYQEMLAKVGVADRRELISKYALTCNEMLAYWLDWCENATLSFHTTMLFCYTIEAQPTDVVLYIPLKDIEEQANISRTKPCGVRDYSSDMTSMIVYSGEDRTYETKIPLQQGCGCDIDVNSVRCCLVIMK